MIFKSINYSKMLLETLRGFSINKSGNLSVIYKICISCLYPFQVIWDIFDNQNPELSDMFNSRRILKLIAACEWQIGNVENLLNYLFDPVYKRINIAQTLDVTAKWANNFDDSPGLENLYVNNFDDSPALDEQYFLNFNSVSILQSIAYINIPFDDTDPRYTALDSVVNMIRLKGTKYELNTI
jgi:hypothetical protein